MADMPGRQQWIAECVARVLERLEQRRSAELTVDMRQLADRGATAIAIRYARLRITGTGPDFWRRLSAGRKDDAGISALRQAWHYGLVVTLAIDPPCFALLPVGGLSGLPLRFATGKGQPVHLMARRVVGYRHIAALAPGYLVVASGVLLTALARDEISKRRLQLFRQV